MGENTITSELDHVKMREYVRALLEDVHALERMLETERLEKGVSRIGAEQELFLVDANLRPKACVLKVLEHLKDKPFTTELAQYNLETNLSPQLLGGDCLSKMHAELDEMIGLARMAASREG
ncbi:MAG: hypothetical protein ACKO32_11430, partial [Planctomycetia bacterium]